MFIALTEFETQTIISINITKIAYYKQIRVRSVPDPHADGYVHLMKMAIYFEGNPVPVVVEQDKHTLDSLIMDALSSDL